MSPARPIVEPRGARPPEVLAKTEGLVSLTLVMNPGLAFGMLSGAPDGWRWIAGVLSLVALAILSVIAALLAGGCPIAARRL